MFIRNPYNMSNSCSDSYMYNEIQKALRGEGKIDEGLQEWLGEF